MEFGKNRVQYNDFYWNFYRFDKFDTYFNEYGAPLAEFTAKYAEEEIPKIENYFDYNLDKRIIFIIYNKLSDYRQSNIGLVTGKTESNIGGVVQIDKNKVFLFFEGDYDKFEEQITGAITQVMLNEMIFGNDFKDNVTNTTLINLPEWYVNGLVSFVSKEWDFEIDNRVKDGIMSGKFEKFNRLVGEDATYAGHSFWRYIAEVYGASVIPSILYLTKINKNANSGFFYVLGSSLKELSYDWTGYYLNIYTKQEEDRDLPDEAPILKRPHKKRVYQNIRVSSSGNYIAYVTNQMGQYKIWLYDRQKGKTKRILKREHKLEQITDYSYPILTWHPSGRILTFVIEEEGGISIYFYNLADKKMQSRNILYFDKILDYSFSNDGALMAISAVKEGKTDIYIHNVAAGTDIQVTNDIADDFSPRFINNSKQIIFSSNRISDSLSIAATQTKRALSKDLFIYDYSARSDYLMRLSDDKYINKSLPREISQNRFMLLSDKNGIINRYVSDFDSTINFVDTTVHYRYLARTKPQTNYSKNIIEQDYNNKSNILGEIIYKNGRYYVYQKEYDDLDLLDVNPDPTDFRIEQSKRLTIKDSLRQIERIEIPLDSVQDNKFIYKDDTIYLEVNKIDINHYIFEKERLNYYNQQLRDQDLDITLVEKQEEEEPRARIYQKAFYQNYLVSQIDFTFLNESYQQFTGGAVYFNPGMNLLFKVGTHDLFEDYKITAGMRLPIDFQSSEYLISIENLKKRLDKQLVYHRQTYSNVAGDENLYEVKSITNQLSLVLRYPFSQVTAWVSTLSVRDDQTIYTKSYSYWNPLHQQQILNEPTTHRLWAQLKQEYIFDNTRSLGLNLPAGTRFKIFAEFFQQINHPLDNLVVLGVDFRNYLVIHRNFIWANRLAFSTSQGSSRLIYYLGGVDNWINLIPNRMPTFIPISEIGIDYDQNYVYQTVATNMRGFSQNIRNGNNFAVFNSELRLPIIRYIANYPLSNAFLENLQVIGFFDIGTAWSGLHPWSGENAYDSDIIQWETIEVEIDSDREPIVAGYGFGVRSQLFGYFIRLDWAWGIENMQVLPRVFYLSLSMDF